MDIAEKAKTPTESHADSNKKGRPPKPLPPPIPDTAENIMKALVNTPPKQRRDWDYLKKD